jgi:signal transduction histidine kinase
MASKKNRKVKSVASSRAKFSASRAALRGLMENSFDGLLIVEHVDRIGEANPAACRILGQPIEAVIGSRFRDLCTVHHHAQVLTLERLDRSCVDVLIRKLPGFAPRTRLWILHDVTADRALNEALERKSRLLLETESIGGIGGWEVDVKTGLLSWTPEMRRIMEMPATQEPVTIEESYDFYTEASRPIVREAFNATMARGTPYDLELEAITGQGRRIWVREVCRATMRGGRPISVIGFSQDITERRRIAGLLTSIGDQERARIGADLHDGLGQELTGLSLLLRSVTTRAELDGSALAAELGGLTKLAGKTVETVRHIAYGLLPLELGEFGLRQVLERLARSISETFGVLVTIRFEGEEALMPVGTVAENLYRIAQEAIANAVRHGKAKRVALRVRASQAKTTFTVSDDGIGIDLQRNPDGMGLQIMRYRTRMLGGILDVQPMPRGGTRVRCVIPRNSLF